MWQTAVLVSSRDPSVDLLGGNPTVGHVNKAMDTVGLQSLNRHSKTVPPSIPSCHLKWARGREEGQGDFPALGHQEGESPGHPCVAGDIEEVAACL